MDVVDHLDIEDVDAVVGYLRAARRLREGQECSVRVLAGGVSNRTVLVEVEGDEAWVLKQALEKLRVSVDWFSDPGRVHREALGLRWLAEFAPAGSTTPFLFEDHEHHLFAMRAVPEPHENWKTMLLRGRLERDHVGQFARLLGTVHREGYDRREEVAGVFWDRSYFESLRLEPYYGYATEQVPEAAGFLGALTEQTRACRDTLVHGDYSPKNVLVHEGKLVLLDHEVVHFGEPAFDLGFSLTHLLSKAHHLPEERGAFADAALLHWTLYRGEIGDPPWASNLEERAVRHTLGCLLARVAGRSPLEYLAGKERERQREVVLSLMSAAPETVAGLVQRFVAEISRRERMENGA